MHFALFILQNQPDPAQIQKMLMTILPLMGILILVGLAVVILPCWFICKKAGFSPWLSLLNVVPFGQLILLYVLAFAEWKVQPVPTTQIPYPYPPTPPRP